MFQMKAQLTTFQFSSSFIQIIYIILISLFQQGTIKHCNDIISRAGHNKTMKLSRSPDQNNARRPLLNTRRLIKDRLQYFGPLSVHKYSFLSIYTYLYSSWHIYSLVSRHQMLIIEQIRLKLKLYDPSPSNLVHFRFY